MISEVTLSFDQIGRIGAAAKGRICELHGIVLPEADGTMS